MNQECANCSKDWFQNQALSKRLYNLCPLQSVAIHTLCVSVFLVARRKAIDAYHRLQEGTVGGKEEEQAQTLLKNSQESPSPAPSRVACESGDEHVVQRCVSVCRPFSCSSLHHSACTHLLSSFAAMTDH